MREHKRKSTHARARVQEHLYLPLAVLAAQPPRSRICSKAAAATSQLGCQPSINLVSKQPQNADQQFGKGYRACLLAFPDLKLGTLTSTVSTAYCTERNEEQPYNNGLPQVKAGYSCPPHRFKPTAPLQGPSRLIYSSTYILVKRICLRHASRSATRCPS